MLERLISLVGSLWQKRQLRFNTYFLVTVLMLCVINHIIKNAKYHSDSDNRKQVNNVIKNINGLSEDKITVTQELFWTDYTDFDKNIVSFDGDKFI